MFRPRFHGLGGNATGEADGSGVGEHFVQNHSSRPTERLRRIGAAVREFESAKGGLPPGGLISPFPVGTNICLQPGGGGAFNPNACFDHLGLRGGQTFSWLVLILPFLGEQELFDEFDFDRTIYTLKSNPHEAVLPQLICPANGPTEPHYNGTGLAQAAGRLYAKGNYAAWVSPVHHDLQLFYRSALGGFMPGERVGQPLQRIVDGLSHSLLASDKLVSCAQPAYAASQQMPCETIAFMATAPRSMHPGGINAVFLDGRVQFLANDIDAMTFTYLVCTHDLQSGSRARAK